MKRAVLAITLSLVMVFGLIGAASAISNGTEDGNGHPYVGLLVAKDADGAPLWRCSGTLMSPTVFLTAGHCTEAPAVTATIWFEADVQSLGYDIENPDMYPNGGPTTVNGTVYTHPNFNSDAFYLYDLGVVVLDTPVYMETYGKLPAQDMLDALKTQRGKKDLTFTAVGYGVQQSFPDAAAWKENNVKVRMVAYPKLIQINVPGATGDFSILLSNNTHTGGTCFGDSGGPNFIGDTNIVGGVTSFGKNSTCGGTGGVYRVDRADDLAWLASFGIVP